MADTPTIDWDIVTFSNGERCTLHFLRQGADARALLEERCVPEVEIQWALEFAGKPRTFDDFDAIDRLIAEAEGGIER